MERTDLPVLPQKLLLDDRRKLSVTGVQDIERFDESAVILHTNRGILIVRGRELHLRQLSPDGGQIAVEGEIDALIYEESRKEGGFWARLFG